MKLLRVMVPAIVCLMMIAGCRGSAPHTQDVHILDIRDDVANDPLAVAALLESGGGTLQNWSGWWLEEPKNLPPVPLGLTTEVISSREELGGEMKAVAAVLRTMYDGAPLVDEHTALLTEFEADPNPAATGTALLQLAQAAHPGIQLVHCSYRNSEAANKAVAQFRGPQGRSFSTCCDLVSHYKRMAVTQDENEIRRFIADNPDLDHATMVSMARKLDDTVHGFDRCARSRSIAKEVPRFDELRAEMQAIAVDLN